MSLESLAKIFLGLGLTLLVLAGAFFLVAKLGWTKLPGDIVYRGKNVIVYVPLGLMLLLSLVGSLLLHFLSRR